MDPTTLLQQMQQQTQQAQQQMEAAAAHATEQLSWVFGFVVCFNILAFILGWLWLRWFLLHVFGIQQKRFFAELDLFLYQRGIAPHVPESQQPAPRQQPAESSRVKEVAKDLVASLDKLAEPKRPNSTVPANSDQTPLERAWRELQNPGRPPASPEDARYMPKN